MAGIFKAYDIRGIVDQELTREVAYQIGFSLSKKIFASNQEILVSKDMRVHSDQMTLYLVNGLVHGGCKVIYAGLCATPMNYWANVNYQVSGSIQVTASHNGPEYNGFKISGSNAIPLDYSHGLDKVEKFISNNSNSQELNLKNKKISALKELEDSQSLKNIEKEVLNLYLDFMLKFVDLRQARPKRKLKIAIDAANGMAGLFIREFTQECLSFIEPVELYWDLDGNFPNHEADPIKKQNLKDLQKKVLEERCDFGVAFDGDADRCVFVDQAGEIIPADLTTALIAEEIIKQSSSSSKPAILYDLRSSKIVEETVKSKGGEPVKTRVGHSFIKRLLKEKSSPFAGELSGHYYFADCFYTDSALMAFICLLNILERSREKKLSEIVSKYNKYKRSGEINFRVKDSQELLEKVKKTYQEKYRDLEIDYLDGLTISVNNLFWFNLRRSNTENSLVRLNFEAYLEKDFKEGFKELESLIKA